MYWNHRLMEVVEGKGTTYEEALLYVREVYYNEDGTIMGWTEKEIVYGESVDEIRQTLNWILESLDKPILNEEQLLNDAERHGRMEELMNEPVETFDNIEDLLASLDREDEDLGN